MKVRNKIVDSINSRIIRPYIEKYFKYTPYGRSIAKLKDVYKGKRCFLIGNGPSLKSEDLTRLYENNEITFAFNRIYNIFDDTKWRPTFYISQDEKMLGGCVEIVDKLNLPVKFIPIQLHWYHGIDIHDAVYFNMNWQKLEQPKDYLFSNNVAHEVACASTGMYTAVQFAAYMGFSEIYLIGVDHHFQISQNNQGEIIIDNSVKDYFSEKYNEDKAQLYIPNTEKSTETYVAMKIRCEEQGIKVYNATRGGKLEVFPRKEFDELFS